jgi:hypothetical protein
VTASRLWLPALLLAAASAHGQDAVSVTAKVDKTEVVLGEPFVLELEAKGPPDAGYAFPAELQGESVELVSLARLSPPPGATPEPWPPGVHRYAARAYALGEVEVPPLTVTYRRSAGPPGEAASPPVKIRVQSALPKNTEDRSLADIREPVGLRVGRPFWIAAGLGLALAAAAAYLVWRRLRRPAPSAPALPAPVLGPGEEARLALERLARSSMLVQGDARGYYIALTAVAKRYLERRLGAPILEMTTLETMAFLRDHPRGADLVPVMRDLAPAADQVKFARGSALREDAERHGAAVRAMVDALEARFEAEARAAAAETAAKTKAKVA